MMVQIHTLVRSCSSRSQRGGDGRGWRYLSGPETALANEGEIWTRCFLPFSSRRRPAKVANEQISAEQGVLDEGKVLYWGLDVAEGCSSAYMVEPSTTNHPPAVSITC